MKKLVVVALAMLAIASTGFAQELVEAESCPISVEGTLDLYSQFVWRGWQRNDEPVAQPAAAVTLEMNEYGSLNAGVWANYDFTNFKKHDGRADGFSWIDYTVNYGIDVRDVSFEVGNIWYTYPRGKNEPSTREVYGAVAYNNDFVVPSLAVYYDYDEHDGFYGNFALSKDIEITEQVKTGVFAALGAGDDDYNRSYGLTRDEALIDFNLGANVSYAINEIFSVGATLVYTSIVDSGIRNNVDPAQDKDMLWGGVNLAAAF